MVRSVNYKKMYVEHPIRKFPPDFRIHRNIHSSEYFKVVSNVGKTIGLWAKEKKADINNIVKSGSKPHGEKDSEGSTKIKYRKKLSSQDDNSYYHDNKNSQYETGEKENFVING